MEFLAELLFEALGEIFLERGAEAAADRRLPRWLRVLILSLIVLFFAAVFALIAAVGVIMAADGRPVAGVLMFALDLALIFFYVHKFRNILRAFSRK